MHQLGRIAMLLLLLVLLTVCLLGFRLSRGPLQLPDLASWLATAASGQGITVQMQEADLAWAGYHEGGGVPLYLRLGDIEVRNAEGVELVAIPSARLEVLPAALFGAQAPFLVSGTDARFPGSAVPVSLQAAIHLGHGFRLTRAEVSVTLGAGRLGAGEDSLPIDGGGFTVTVTPRSAQLTNGHLALAHIGNSAPKLGLIGTAQRNRFWLGSVTATVDAVQAQDLAAYWPPSAVPQTRKWVTGNITGGAATDAIFTFNLAAPSDLATLNLNGVSGHFTGRNITLTWIPHARPITQLNGELVLLNNDRMVITADTAKLGGLDLTAGRMDITGLNARDQTGALSLKLAGPLAQALAILNAPPLDLLHQAPPQVAQATGEVTGTVQAGIPFKNSLRLADVDLHVRTELSDLAFASPVAGLDFSQGNALLTATNARLAVAAHGQFAGEPATLAVSADFNNGNATTMALDSLTGSVLRQKLGVDASSVFAAALTSKLPYAVRITGNGAGTQTASLDANLTPAALALPIFAWSKDSGAPGRLVLSATLRRGTLVALNSLSATAPGLSIQGWGEDNRLVISSAEIGRTQGHGVLNAPAGPQGAWTAIFTGPVLDIRMPKQQASPPAPPGAASTSSGPAWGVKLDFQQLDLSPNPAPDLASFVFSGTGQGGAITQAQGSAGGSAFSVTTTGPALHHLTLTAPDAGMLLRALGVTDRMQGGALSLEADYGDAQATHGTLNLTQFHILKTSGFAKALQAAAVHGAPPPASLSAGLALNRAVVPFTLDDQALHLHGARAFSNSLGFTASGSILRATGIADLDATIVPAYWLNALPGKLPVIGQLFTAEKGGGLFAMRVKITGPLTDPLVKVNPLSALTPGVLRDIFGVDESPAP